MMTSPPGGTAPAAELKIHPASAELHAQRRRRSRRSKQRGGGETGGGTETVPVNETIMATETSNIKDKMQRKL